MKIKAITDFTYLPFGIAAILAPWDFWINTIMLIVSTAPAATIGIRNIQMNYFMQTTYDFLSYFFQPFIRLGFAIGGITYVIGLTIGVPMQDAWLATLAVTFPSMCSYSWISTKWLKEVMKESAKKQQPQIMKYLPE